MECQYQPESDLQECQPWQPTAWQTCSW